MNFKKARTFVLFLGFHQSGHSFIAALIDVHPNVVIGNELKANEPLEVINHRRQWQNRYSVPPQLPKKDILVVGSKNQTNELPTVELPTKYILVVRNPFHNIASTVQRGKPLDKVVESYTRYCQEVDSILTHSDIFVIHLEQLCLSPRLHMAEICEFGGIPLDYEWLENCANKVEQKPNTPSIDWPANTFEQISRLTKTYDWLNLYSEDNDE